ncbi:putative sulfur oxidation protein (SoxA); cytochrome c precursor [Bradyrhizobium sp. ORS 278]|uniref:sulfur oxidation c-type cytochrome SoxA n=1 Tax=Bradyrhizobium sp. (strain ORS 278) TaxID=114615 RepID=UPI0001508A5A|nr:sulfur oxidation c-type cytochrome SoxA [Bradyrhizobium sp. ORS 278]CAL76979.1 putative sulfur oxidation protein (SoxA); cytochrome c precursor [Bradyrhizobium sp. ORS 278]
MSIRYGSLAVLATAALTLSAIAVFGQEAERKGIPAPPGHVFKTIISGYQFRTKETRALQDDDLENPGFLAVERAADVWKSVDGSEGKSCMSCHGEAETTMKGVGAAMPKWSEKLNKPVNLEQQINICRTEHMKAQPWAFKSKELTDMTTFVRFQSRGMPVAVKTDGPMSPWFEKGKEIYYTRVGQLDLACASCHEKNNGKFMRADFLSQGQTNGFPTYRLRDQRLIPLHERFEGCMFDVRGVPYKPLSDEFLALELYVAWRGIGLPVETPSVRN